MRRKANPKHPPGSPAWWAGRTASVKNPVAPGVGRPPVPLERLLATATELIDQTGPASLSLRHLAERLGSGTATIYRHFASKDEILACVVDRVLGEVELDAPQMVKMDWRQALMHGAEALYKVLQSHPGVVPLLTSQIPIGPNALAHREKALAFLLASGFSAQFAARGYSAIMHYVFGFASQLTTPFLSPTRGADLRNFYERLDRSAFPATVSVADHLPMISDDEEFHFGLGLIVEGLARDRDRLSLRSSAHAKRRVVAASA